MKTKFLILIGMVSVLASCDAMLPIYPNSNSTSNYPSYPNSGNGGYQSENFSGRYTNQSDPNRSSEFTISLSQSGTHISGTARNTTGDGNDSGLLSVDGYVDGDVADIQFFDQKGNMVASGVLSHNQDGYSFIQNSTSSYIPTESFMYRVR